MHDETKELQVLIEGLSIFSLPFAILACDRVGRIIQANQEARDMLQLASTWDRGKYLQDFSRDPFELKLLGDGSVESWTQNEVRLSLNQREILVESYLRPLRASDGNQLGYICCLIDVADKVEVKRKLIEFQDDVGNVLHSYTSALIMMQHTIDAVILSLGPNPFPEGKLVSPVTASEALSRPVSHLVASIEKVLDWLSLQEQSEPDFIQILNKALGVLRSYDREIPSEFHAAVLGDTCATLLNLLERYDKKHLRRELARQIKADVLALSRVINLIQLLQVKSVIEEMDPQLRTLRELVLLDRRLERVKPRVVYLRDLIARAIASLSEFARSRSVSLRIRNVPPDTLVEVDEREVVRALSNILHNAIKYSWSRAGTDPWVEITTRLHHGVLSTEIKSWGVPISRDEIDQGLIFKIGYRGRLSSDRGRLGTGVGLADARRVAQLHGGEIHVSSVPASPGGDESDYEQPFLTTVSFDLPVYSKR